MTTPHQGPGMWQQGDTDAAVRWLASLDTADQVALRRSMQTQRTLAPIYNAVNRTIETGRTWADQTRSDIADLREQTGVAANLAAIRLNETLDGTGRAISTGAKAARNAAVSAPGAIGRAGARAGKGLASAPGRMSRWVKAKFSNGVGRAGAGLEAMRQFKDPNLGGGPSQPSARSGELSPNAINATAAQVHAFATAGSAADRQAALNSLVGSMDKDNQAMLMAALINSGQSPAAGAVTAAPAQTPDEPSAQGKPEKGPDLTK
ncbi:hypothetical protein ACIA49_18605 [Kribbella sp. NPDC051587]|uniref:hypothetical protein n=1 Tax=Kribbella sp. NPDC051587 TaxID=3364119 RepID=UPI00379C0C67